MEYFNPKILILLFAVIIDLIVGDPHFLWHPVRGIGKLITWFENFYRRIFSVFYDEKNVKESHIEEPEQGIADQSHSKETKQDTSDHSKIISQKKKIRENFAGFCLAVSVIIVTAGITLLIFKILTILENNISIPGSANAFSKKYFGMNGIFTFIFSLILTTQCLSARQLSRESNKVYDALTGEKIVCEKTGAGDQEKTEACDQETNEAGDHQNAKENENSGENDFAWKNENAGKIENALDNTCHEERLKNARRAVSMIVGRDTEKLSEEGVTKACIETIAENTSDGVIAPMFYLVLFGPIGGIIYKAINTMDSMIGYKNNRYRYFGTFAARLDDVVNFIPARISGFLMVVSAYFIHFDGKNSWKIWRRDSRKSKSPNSAQCEAACAGALGISLLGNAYYFGVLFEKPSIGDAIRPVEAEDIKRTQKLMYMTEALFMALSALILWGIFH